VTVTRSGKAAASRCTVGVSKVHADAAILMDGESDRIDPDKLRPLIMSFQQFYGLMPGRVHASELANIPEAASGLSQRTHGPAAEGVESGRCISPFRLVAFASTVIRRSLRRSRPGIAPLPARIIWMPDRFGAIVPAPLGRPFSTSRKSSRRKWLQSGRRP
jgi:hypothetical protein